MLQNTEPGPPIVFSTRDVTIRALEYLPDGQRVVTGSEDGIIRIQNLENGEQEGIQMVHGTSLSGLAVTQDGTKIVSSGVIGDIKVWDVELHQVFGQWSYPVASPEVAISSDNRFVAVGKFEVYFHNLEGKQILRSIKVQTLIWSMSFSPDGKRIACGTVAGIRMYDITSTTLVFHLFHNRGYDMIRRVQWSRDGYTIFASHMFLHSASERRSVIRCWNTVTGQQIGQPWTGHTNEINSISLSPDESFLVSSSKDETIRFWDTTSGTPVKQYSGDMRVVCFSPSGKSVASAGSNGKLYVWNVSGWLNSNENVSTEIAHSDISSEPRNTLPAAEQPADLRKINFDTYFPPPPDLTHHLAKVDDQYYAGGGFGDVYKCLFRDTGEKEVAVKAFRFKFDIDGDQDDRSMKMLRRELGIWRRLDHINIVPFLGITYGFGMRNSMSLVSLWMPNDSLYVFMEKHGNDVGLEHRLQLLLDIANGLQYLHSIPIVHGDLNCNNVLLDADYNARLIDFGYASLIGNTPEALGYLQRTTMRPGALRWSAPEQVNSEEYTRTTKTDIYAFGCIALQVLSGKQPWSEVREDVAVVLRLSKGHTPGRPISRWIDDAHWNLIQDCWSSIENRPNADATIPRIQSFVDRFSQFRPLRDLLASQPSPVQSTLINSSPSISPIITSKNGSDSDNFEGDNQAMDTGSLSLPIGVPSESAKAKLSLPLAEQRGHSPPQTRTYTDNGRPILFYVKALYNYAAMIDEEFDFQAGDTIAVTDTPEDGWWSGELLDDTRRQTGRHVFPSNFVCLL